jgi:predicted transcriptional regulator
MEKKMIPYSFYLPEDVHAKLKEFAKERKASALIRDAIVMILSGNDIHTAGYNRGLADAAKVVFDCEEAQMVAVRGRDIGAVLCDRIKELAK